MSPRHLYLGLCVLGTVLPYLQLAPFLHQYGWNVHQFISQLFGTPVSGFFGVDVIVSSMVLWAFVAIDGRRDGLRRLWAPIVANLLVGVSLGLPLFLYMRELRREAGAAEAVGVECIIPILRVASLPASIRYYVDVLGFIADWGDEAGSEMASVSCNGQSIMLSQNQQGQPGTWIWIGVADIAPLFEEYRGRGARFRQHPVNRPWAYEMQVEDPDGHVLRFGSEPRVAS